MKPERLRHQLLRRYGTIAASAKALATKPATLEKWLSGEQDMPFRAVRRAIEALGLEDNPAEIERIFG